MSKNLLNPNDKQAILNRIDKVQPDKPAQWGVMNAHQMLCHIADQLKLATGEIQVKDNSSFQTRKIVKNLVLMGMPLPKGKIPTYKEIDYVRGSAKEKEFISDKAATVAQIEDFIAKGKDYNWQPHPTFGPMNFKQWGRLAYTHIDHHLKQFGC